MLNNKAYDRKKDSLKKNLESFLFSHSKSFSTATPEDIRLFLVNMDAKGKTKVHDVCWPFLGEKRSKECSCPSRLAFGTVTSLVSQLNVIFDDLGRKGEWTESGLLKYDNPVSSGAVMWYSEEVKLEQAKAHIPVTQAKPPFLGKRKVMNNHITEVG